MALLLTASGPATNGRAPTPTLEHAMSLTDCLVILLVLADAALAVYGVLLLTRRAR